MSLHVHLLDVGTQEYSDAVLIEFDNTTVLIDGAHPGDHDGSPGHDSIPAQLKAILEHDPPFQISLLIVTHAHEDHIGCLPKLVEDGIVKADWALAVDPDLGWGIGVDSLPPDPMSPKVKRLVAALREEPRTEGTDDQTLQQFLIDVVNLETKYRNMLTKLKNQGTKVVHFGQDDPAELVAAFQQIGLKILGPAQSQVLKCAELIAGITHDAIRIVSDLFQQDANRDPVSTYRELIEGGLDSLDVSRPGPPINLQSIVTQFEYQGKKLLFAGDMQFADPQVSNDFVKTKVQELRDKIQQEAPYDFVKLSHHGSDNAFDQEIFVELGQTPLFGICAGENSTKHPHVDTLNILKANQDHIQWVRTDHNRLSTISFVDQNAPQIEVEEGDINDPVPNSVDLPGATTEEEETTTPVVSEIKVQESGIPSIVEVIAKIPHTKTRVTITVDVEPHNGNVALPALTSRRDELPTVQIASGRQLPSLLFITSKAALSKNIGVAECEYLLKTFRQQGKRIYDALPEGITKPIDAFALVRQELQKLPAAEGVVILGGYDVVPSQIVDCLESADRQALRDNSDPDDFIVWSDEMYGDKDNAGFPELPVSRIPDGKSADLMFAAVQAPNKKISKRNGGIRNIARPFAETVFKNIKEGTEKLMISAPSTFQNQTKTGLAADRLYLMLHGDYIDSTRFWGEETDDNLEAINVGNLPDQCGNVVFTGCCWGALTIDTPAGRLIKGRPYGIKSLESSLALNFLRRGVTAFVGCTGAHYSPLEYPYQYFAAPLHVAFWRNYIQNQSPAKALFDAKMEYFKNIPHGQDGQLARAIEYKVWREYTCLGLGW
ncbi:MBL fold metallo-hydrolase [bacterium]|nr:MBL fold metallo-hydrolase [bacterium]